jgi:hypothetical protein
MPRDGSGTYSVPNTFVPNTTMSASAVNQNFVDAGSELTNSLARDGQSAMSGQLKVIDGTAGAPGIAFGSDLKTGFRRASASEMRWVAGSVDAFYIDSVGKAFQLYGMEILGTLSLSGALAGSGIPNLAAIEALTGKGLLKRTGTATWALDTITTALEFSVNANGNVIATGVAGDFVAPYDMVITGVTVLADQSGSLVLDIWKDSYANYPPTVADTITASAKPTLSSASKYTDGTLTGWSTTVTAGDTFRVNVDSVATITRFTLIITGTRFA